MRTLLTICICIGAFLFCGCDPGVFPPDQTLTPAEVLDVLNAAGDKLGELFDQGQDDVAAALVTFLETRPEVDDAQSAGGAVWAKLTDGTVLGVINNRDVSEYTPDSESAKSVSANQRSLPAVDSVRLIKTLGTWFISPRDKLSDWFSTRRYTVHETSGTIEDLKNVTGEGVFYIDAHGGRIPAGFLPELEDEDGTPIPDPLDHFALSTSTPVDEATLQEYFADARLGNLVTIVAVHDRAANGRPIMARHFAITDRFIQAYHWQFSPRCLVFMNACSSDNDVLKQACFTAGAGFYLGWTAPCNDLDACLGARFFFDRALGANDTLPNHSPPQRPFSYNEVWSAMKRVTKDQVQTTSGPLPYNGLTYDTSMIPGETSRGISIVPNRPKLILSSPTPDNGILMPGLINLQIDEANEQVKLIGDFGPEAGEVFMNESSVQVTWGENTITCSIPRSGAGSAGDVYVKVNNHVSNRRHLTAWSGSLRNHQTGNESLFLDHRWTVRFRADVGTYRASDGCDLEPSRQFITTYATKDATVTWNAGGSYTYHDEETDEDVTETWTKGPDHDEQYMIPSALALTPNNFDFRVYFDPTANTLSMGTATYIDEAYYNHLSTATPEGPGSLMPGHVFRSNRRDDGTYPPMVTGGSYDIAGGLNHYSQSVLLQSTFEWDAMAAESPPDPAAPQ